MSATHNSNVMPEFRDYVVISSWTGTVTPAVQDMLRLTTNGTDFMQELLSTENQYRTRPFSRENGCRQAPPPSRAATKLGRTRPKLMSYPRGDPQSLVGHLPLPRPHMVAAKFGSRTSGGRTSFRRLGHVILLWPGHRLQESRLPGRIERGERSGSSGAPLRTSME